MGVWDLREGVFEVREFGGSLRWVQQIVRVSHGVRSDEVADAHEDVTLDGVISAEVEVVVVLHVVPNTVEEFLLRLEGCCEE